MQEKNIYTNKCISKIIYKKSQGLFIWSIKQHLAIISGPGNSIKN